MKKRIAVIKGDGIGPEVVGEAVKALDAVGEKFGHAFRYEEVLAGGASIDQRGVPLTEEAVSVCKACDAVILGAVGGPKWDGLPGNLRPERALLGIRKELKLFANIRPAVLYGELAEACPLKESIAKKGIDLVVMRELTGGIYFGKRGRTGDGNGAFDTEVYSRGEVERIALKAFELARLRRKKVTSIDKANVLETSRLWRETVHEAALKYPDVTLEDMLVDNAAMQLVKDPSQFDVVLASNMFGDILSDEAAMVTGSIGMLASASVGESAPYLYEPAHGSAPDIAGQDRANPLATILCAAMMLRLSFGLGREADALENAVKAVLHKGYATADIAFAGSTVIGTKAMGQRVIECLLE
jgi:3-isopropylmalate dehydrogenase